MRKTGLLLAVAAFLGAGALAYAAPYPALTGSVSVCDPNDPSHCLAPASDGSLAVTGGGGGGGTTPVAPLATTAVASSLVLKASSGNLSGIQATSGATAGFLLVFNATSAPADGAVTPIKCFVLPANSTVGATFDPPALLATGVTAVFSSTGCFTKTASATAYISGQVQ